MTDSIISVTTSESLAFAHIRLLKKQLSGNYVNVDKSFNVLQKKHYYAIQVSKEVLKALNLKTDFPLEHFFASIP